MESFHQRLTEYIKQNDKGNATLIVLQELAVCLMRERDNFIHILQHSGVNVSENATDLDLIDKFVRNAPRNKQLLLGASFLINHANKISNYDGTNEISDVGVKNTYRVLRTYFVDSFPSEVEEQSNWIGAVAGLAGKVLPNLLGKKKEKSGGGQARVAAPSPKIKELEAALAMQKKITEEKKQEAIRAKNAQIRAEKKTKNIIMYGGLAVGVLVIALVIYINNKKR